MIREKPYFKLSIIFFQMELDSKDLMIDRLNSQNKQRALNTSINENDEISVSGKTVTRVLHCCILTSGYHAMSLIDAA